MACTSERRAASRGEGIPRRSGPERHMQHRDDDAHALQTGQSEIQHLVAIVL
jgi:hypothetical protein